MAARKTNRTSKALDVLYEQRLEEFLREKLGFSEETIMNSRPRRKAAGENDPAPR